MLCFKSLLFCLVTAFLLFSCIPFSFSLGVGEQAFFPATSGKYGERNSGMVFSWGRTERFLAESDEPPVNSTLALAANRTYRKDPLNNFKKYRGGWNISERHYWASVAFTAAPFFVIAAAWFLLFALCLLIICLHHCCCRKEPYGYSRIAYALSLILLILFTIAAIIGCVVLYTGQGKYHSSTINTLEYVVHQANTASDKLRNVSELLSAAKKVGVDQVFLPSNVQSDIDRIQTKINSSASTLATRTEDNSKDIKNIIESVRLALIILSAIMLMLTFLGFVFSIFGMQFLVYVLVILGWILVTGTFILCGIFLLLHNVTADACVAMDQWVQNPMAHTALDDILPCVDNATAQETLTKSKEVTSQLANIMNFVVNNVSNINFPPNVPTLYFNQSGPLLPSLCNPFNPDLTDRACNPGEVDLENATQVWKNYVCDVSPNGTCVTTGRLTPTFYSQMAAGVNISYGLYRYGPFLVDLQDCTFVRQTFTDIYGTYCPGLRRYSSWIYVGLVMVATAVMLSLLFWVIYGRERKHRVYTKELAPRFSEGHEGDKP
ncbi:uncharacterized protein LOC111389910 [Olea europaea subsp. europaea]|uniref:Uncharacterized protein LOC111389910 n=1 Tax=Olea europaea subsp. europaea TaxID=158383 RepID=A0A8S0VDR4_OLEEU|nr:uncharacterized protein LOC111389910 [Olea europaea subsp. europaea]